MVETSSSDSHKVSNLSKEKQERRLFVSLVSNISFVVGIILVMTLSRNEINNIILALALISVLIAVCFFIQLARDYFIQRKNCEKVKYAT